MENYFHIVKNSSLILVDKLKNHSIVFGDKMKEIEKNYKEKFSKFLTGLTFFNNTNKDAKNNKNYNDNGAVSVDNINTFNKSYNSYTNFANENRYKNFNDFNRKYISYGDESNEVLNDESSNVSIYNILFSFGWVLSIILIAFILLSVCMRKRTHGRKYYKAPVVVTSSTHTPANAGGNYGNDEIRGYQTQAPYPSTAYPMPQPAPVHTAAPYPINTTGMPMPQPQGQYPPAQPQTGYQAPYPPAQNPQDVLPPSYDQVVGQTGGPTEPATVPYNKQSPYNPHFTGN